MESHAFYHNVNPIPERKSVVARCLPHRRGDKMRATPTLSSSIRRRTAAHIAFRLVLLASMFSTTLSGMPAWNQLQLASALAAATPTTPPDFGTEHDCINGAKS